MLPLSLVMAFVLSQLSYERLRHCSLGKVNCRSKVRNSIDLRTRHLRWIILRFDAYSNLKSQ